MATPTGIAVAVRQAASGYALRGLPQRKTYTTSWDINSEQLALGVYERTMVANRTNAAGRIIGGRIHAIVRSTPLVLPIGFSALWLYAYLFAPVLAK